MDRRIRRLGLALVVLFTLLFAQLNYIQFFGAERLADRPDNTRRQQRTYSRPRGEIRASDGSVLAVSVDDRSSYKYRRIYPQGELFSAVTGYFGFINGSTGGTTHSVYADEGELLTAYVLGTPAGGTGKFVIHANVGRPNKLSPVVMPGGLGIGCFPILTSQGGHPIAVWNSIGRAVEIGNNFYFDGSELPVPERAPVIIFQLNNGDPVNLPSGTVVTFQGAISGLGVGLGKEAKLPLLRIVERLRTGMALPVIAQLAEEEIVDEPLFEDRLASRQSQAVQVAKSQVTQRSILVACKP